MTTDDVSIENDQPRIPRWLLALLVTVAILGLGAVLGLWIFADQIVGFYILRGDAKLAERRYEEAITEYQLGSQLRLFDQTAAADALLKVGGVYETQKKYDQAVIQYQKAVSVAPRYAPGSLRLGNVYLKVQQYSAASASFSEVSQYQADDSQKTEASLGLGKALFYQAKYDEAASYIDAAKQVTDNDEAKTFALYEAVARYHGQETLPDAKHLSTRLQDAAKAVAEISPDTADLFSNTVKAAFFVAADEPAVAVMFIDQALAVDAHYRDALVLKTLAMYQQNKFQEALDTANAAIAVDSTYGLSHYIRAIALSGFPDNFAKDTGPELSDMGKDRLHQADDAFNKARQLDYENFTVLNDLAATLEAQGRYLDAISLLWEAYQVADNQIAKERVFFRLAWNMYLRTLSDTFIDQELKDFNDRLVEIDGVVKKTAFRSASGYNAMAMVNLAYKNPDSVAELLVQARSTDPYGPDSYAVEVLLMVATGDRAAAKKAFDRLVELDIDNMWTHRMPVLFTSDNAF